MPIEITPVSGMEQLERWVAIQKEVFPDDPQDASMMALIRAQEPGHVDFLASIEGEPVGAAMLTDSQSTDRPWFEISVPVRHRGQGIGGALFEAVSALARERLAKGLACEVRADDAYSRAFAERRGFTEDARLTQCTLDLTSELPLPAIRKASSSSGSRSGPLCSRTCTRSPSGPIPSSSAIALSSPRAS